MGDIDIMAETEIDGRIVSETYNVWDTLFYDKATNGTGEKNTNWNESNATATPTSDGTVLSNSSDNFGYYRTTQTFNSPISIEFDIVYSGTCGIDLNASGSHRMTFSDLGVVTGKSIKLVYDGETIKCYIDGSSTPSKTFTPSESYSNFKFGFYIRNSSSTLTYKNLKIYSA